ncbi:YlxR family protein [Saccharomonospora sp. NPDC046836]|uniref:YlxR family protein n=1 Tax=Saccharomonospora sp. NPDC046836 TaxID=3156921 RepID=UPI0033EF84FE
MRGHGLNWDVVQRPRSNPACQQDEAVPVRTCVGCRQRALIGELLRVVAVGGALVVDERRRLPGRGAWVHPVAECLAKAERRRAFSRALRVQGTLDTGGVRGHVEGLAEQNADPGCSRVRNRNKEAGRPVMSQP